FHDEPFSAKQTNAQAALKCNPDADALGRRQKRVLLSDQFASDFRQVYRNDLARIRSAESHSLLSAATTIQKHRHEQRLAREQALSGTEQRAQKSVLLL